MSEFPAHRGENIYDSPKIQELADKINLADEFRQNIFLRKDIDPSRDGKVTWHLTYNRVGKTLDSEFDGHGHAIFSMRGKVIYVRDVDQPRGRMNYITWRS